jgi:outer membrane protein assembly factor BamB
MSAFKALIEKSYMRNRFIHENCFSQISKKLIEEKKPKEETINLKIKTNNIISIIAILIMATGMLAAISPAANAHTPAWTIPTYAYLSITPNPQQVNNNLHLEMWLNALVPTSGGLGGDRWHNFKIDVTAPDGTKQTLGPFESNQPGDQQASFVPNQIGNYTFVFSYPGQVLTNGTGVPNIAGVAYVGDYFQPSQSTPVSVMVQQGPIPIWIPTPLPTGYWQLPIQAENREWGDALASNWLKGTWLINGFQSSGQAPNSPHILWQVPMPDTPGGILDASWGNIETNVEDYEAPWTTPIIMNGIIYFNTPAVSTTARTGYYAMDLYTGKQLWFNNGSSIPNMGGMYNQIYSGLGGAGVYSGQAFPALSLGQLYYYHSVNGQGVLSYLWSQVGTTWYLLDPETGNWLLTLINVPSGTAATDQDGSLLLYSYNSNTGNLLCWNSSQAIPPASPIGTGQQQWKISIGATIDAVNDTRWTQWGIYQDFTAADIAPRSGYTMNVTIPKGLGSISRVIEDANRVPKYIFGFSNPNVGGSVTGGNGIYNAWCVQINYGVAPYSPYPNETFTQNNNLGYTATLLWSKTYSPPIPSGNITYSLGPSDYSTGIWTVFAKETMQWWGYSITTGQQVWGPTAPENVWDMYGDNTAVAYGNLYAESFGGILYCYNMTTGALKWTYTATGLGEESPFGNYPLTQGFGGVADGKVFVYSALIYSRQPLWRGTSLRCLDAFTGKELWKLQDWNLGLAIADGYAVTGNQFNNMIDCIGIGPSATTVAVSNALGTGSGTLITGTVTDQSPGQTDTGAPAAGTPAISDTNMEAWMEYLYEQQAMPTNATGVPVTITATDPNGNYQFIGNVTSDITGSYAIAWTPPVPGVYTVTATFAGSKSYSSSSAETHFLWTKSTSQPVGSPSISTPTQTVNPTPTAVQSAQPSPSQASQPPTSSMPTSTLIAIGAVIIVIVAAAAALLLRRRK